MTNDAEALWIKNLGRDSKNRPQVRVFILEAGIDALATKIGDEWAVTPIFVGKIPEYSCLAEFSTRRLDDGVSRLIDELLPNLPEGAAFNTSKGGTMAAPIYAVAQSVYVQMKELLESTLRRAVVEEEDELRQELLNVLQTLREELEDE